jgi:hypothetical protein
VLGEDGRVTRTGVDARIPAHHVGHEQRTTSLCKHPGQTICPRLRHWHQCPAPRRPGQRPCRHAPTGR